MTGFEPRISGIWSDRSTNLATTTALNQLIVQFETNKLSYQLFQRPNT